ncbi:hypothetical protein [Myxococcus sp. CA039A]|uniref:hypothetical protein n=1 Tax=Myxococcus sp. CA039A TaxID=2741737 RepID=UPI00157B85C6|nr:hypothetical protein [Myxococcus sp. CA039A]NTX56978.1 hypothetical protein [Myxococcus sp. CA039A]
MGVADIIAVYGAVLSTALAAAQFVSWWRARKMVGVQVSLRDLYSQDGRRRAPDSVVLIRAINRTDHTLKINGIGMEQVGKKSLASVDGLPAPLHPHDSFDRPLPWDPMAQHFDFDKPVTAYVTLTNGEIFRTKPTVLGAPKVVSGAAAGALGQPEQPTY